METQRDWAKTLRSLRENGNDFLLNAISNVPISFTHDTIIMHAPNESIAELVNRKKELFPENLKIRLPHHEQKIETMEQKLQKLFGERLEVKQ